jgi:hypothetical protein
MKARYMIVTALVLLLGPNTVHAWRYAISQNTVAGLSQKAWEIQKTCVTNPNRPECARLVQLRHVMKLKQGTWVRLHERNDNEGWARVTPFGMNRPCWVTADHVTQRNTGQSGLRVGQRAAPKSQLELLHHNRAGQQPGPDASAHAGEIADGNQAPSQPDAERRPAPLFRASEKR